MHRDYRSGDPTYGVLPTVAGCASCHSHSPEDAIHLAGTGVPVLIYIGQMQSAVGGGVSTRRDTVLQISTCIGKSSIKAILVEMTTKKWYI